jgi:hypothetical protein
VNQRRATILQEIIKKADFLRNEIDIAMVELTEELDSQQKVDETLLGNLENKVYRNTNFLPPIPGDLFQNLRSLKSNPR